jgi:uncharacterized protein YbcI
MEKDMVDQPAPRTQGELEAAFTKQIIQFEKEYLGRGPMEARTFIIEDMVVVRLKGVLTPAEEKLVQTKEGRLLVKEARRQLFDTSRTILSEYANDILGVQLVDFYSDISIESGERVIVLTLDKYVSLKTK